MHPIVCLDSGFSKDFTEPFGWHHGGRLIRADSGADLAEALLTLEQAVASGSHVVFALGYEATPWLMELPGKFRVRHHSEPLLEACIFDGPPEPIVVGEADPGAPWPTWQKPDRLAYCQAFDAIMEAIQGGMCYQVNHTFRVHGTMTASPWTLYQQTSASQPAMYGGFIDFGSRQLVSRSPELFVKKRGDLLRAEPMKGTAPRDQDPIRDQQMLDALLSDPKMQAENLMIVDLIRNDLSRIARSHSVTVPALFAERSLRSVHQVSSVVDARVDEQLSLTALLAALFPCGSVVGAPKAEAAQMIQTLEAEPRGIYTGCIGCMTPDGDLTLSVAIRTLEVRGQSVTLGLGSGLVADSTLTSEWQECLLKGRFAGVLFDD